MRFSTAVAGLTALASTEIMARPHVVERAALATNPPFQVTALVIEDDAAANTTLTFTVYNPEPLAKVAANCSATWPHGSTDYPDNDSAIKCDADTTFAWHFEGSFTDVKAFTLDIQHDFEDPAVGDPPYDHVTVFARGYFNETNIDFEDAGGKVVGTQNSEDPVQLPIYATIA